MLVINVLPPCCKNSGDSKKSVCGNAMHHTECSHCGFNPEENERRRQIGFTVRPDGIRCKIITKGEIADAAIT